MSKSAKNSMQSSAKIIRFILLAVPAALLILAYILLDIIERCGDGAWHLKGFIRRRFTSLPI